MQLAHACCASLLLHAALIAVPAGSLVQRASASPDGATAAGAQFSVLLQRKAASVQRPSVETRNLVGQAAGALQSVAAALPIGIPGPRYYEARELSRRAKAIGDIAPLPPELKRGAESGRLVLVLRIADTGRVDGIDVEQATVDDALATALADRFHALHFHPAERDGVAVASRMKIEVLLRPSGA